MLERALLTIGLLAAALLVAVLIRGAARMATKDAPASRFRFWVAQATHLFVLAAIVGIFVALWLGAPAQRTAVGGYIAAGLTIALQRVVTAFAGYLIILRGKVFSVGDRIMIGGVRGDVVALGFMQTTVMEMGQAPGEKADDPSMWVHGRQYTGRLVRVTNDKIFDTPIYNYTRDFPFMWDELMFPIRYADDYRVVERILLETARKHTAQFQREASEKLEDVREKYFLTESPSVEPRVFMMLTDNWVQLSLRFILRPVGARIVKDAMARDILDALNAAKIGIASGTYAIVEVPTLNVRQVQ